MDEALENLLRDFDLLEVLEQGGLEPEEALKVLFYGGHLDISHLLPEYPDGMEENEAS